MKFIILSRVLAVMALAVLGLGACSQDGGAESAEGEAASATVRVADAAGHGVRLLTAGAAAISEPLTLYGVVAPDAYRTQRVRARYPGVVRAVAKRPGDTVAAGETLLSIESSTSLAPYAVTAAAAGTVLERHVNAGESVDTARELMVVSDLRTVWVQLRVFARDLGRVRQGQPVTVRGTYGDLQAAARLDYVAPAGDVDSQSVVARATLDNRDGRWVPGQFVTGVVTVEEVEAAVAVSPAALQRLGGKTVVFVADGDRFTPRVVDVGLQDAQAVEIRSGLAAGMRYAADNSYLLKADALKGGGGED